MDEPRRDRAANGDTRQHRIANKVQTIVSEKSREGKRGRNTSVASVDSLSAEATFVVVSASGLDDAGTHA
jgi:hypothetical protein